MNPLYMLNRLFWQHPTGDRISLPTFEIRPTHQEGQLNVPCAHWFLDFEHAAWVEVTDSAGHTQRLLFPPLRQQHPSDTLRVEFELPLPTRGADAEVGPPLPCIHPMPLVRQDLGLWTDFYTDDAFIQEEAITAIARLTFEFGVTMSSPGRPLNVFHRRYMEGHPEDETNPFVTHYDPFTHSIQVLDAPWVPVLDHLHYALGHATLGHRIVQAPAPSGFFNTTEMKHPTTAMGEGWAHFVALALRFNAESVPGAGLPLTYNGQGWENRDPAVPRSPNIEYNVGCTLWDLYDYGHVQFPLPPGAEAETVALSFADLFAVYSPSLGTLTYGPLIHSLDEYLERLQQNQLDKRSAILAVRDSNCGWSRGVALSTPAPRSWGVGVTGTRVTAGFSISSSQDWVMEKQEPGALAHEDTVHIKARSSGKYVAAEGGGGSVLNANRSLPYGWETFVIERLAGPGPIADQDQVALRHRDSGLYWCAEDGGGGRVTVDRPARGAWETFTIWLMEP